MSRIHARLSPYVASLCDEAVVTGLPLQRPLFLHHEGDPTAHAVETQYLYGRDLLVAPVIEAGRHDWSVYLPCGSDWIHVWSGARHSGGQNDRRSRTLWQATGLLPVLQPACRTLPNAYNRVRRPMKRPAGFGQERNRFRCVSTGTQRRGIDTIRRQCSRVNRRSYNMGLIIVLIVGGILGWLASIVMRTDAQQGILLNIVVGIVGALLGGFLLGPILGGAPITSGALDIRSLLVSFPRRGDPAGDHQPGASRPRPLSRTTDRKGLRGTCRAAPFYCSSNVTDNVIDSFCSPASMLVSAISLVRAIAIIGIGRGGGDPSPASLIARMRFTERPAAFA